MDAHNPVAHSSPLGATVSNHDGCTPTSFRWPWRMGEIQRGPFRRSKNCPSTKKGMSGVLIPGITMKVLIEGHLIFG
jgi:hypothetical protein